jgi:uroporphyrinogen-III decarboxylase
MATGRQRVEAALRRQECDRLPCFPLVDVCYAAARAGLAMAEVQFDPAVHAAALAQCVRELPVDGVYINLCFDPRQARAAVRRDGEYTVVLDECLEVRMAENDVLAVSRTDLRRLDDPRIERAELFHPGMLATFRAMPADVRQRAAVCVGLTGAFSQLGFLLGLENLLLAMVDRPGAVDEALRKRQAVALRQAEEICGAGARFVWIGEGMASASLIGPAMYRRFVLPHERELARRVRELGGLTLLHICGDITATLEAIAQSGVDGCDVDFPTDWQAAVRVLGPVMGLKGNVNPMLFLPDGACRLADACETTRRSAPSRGFILSTGCLVPRDSTGEAFAIMAAACAAAQPEKGLPCPPL